MNRLLKEYLPRIELGEPQQFKNIVVVPVFADLDSDPDYLTLSEALGQGLATITEVSAAGTVPEVKVSNASDRFLLLVDGEELIGARFRLLTFYPIFDLRSADPRGVEVANPTPAFPTPNSLAMTLDRLHTENLVHRDNQTLEFPLCSRNA
jgi:hypothetical protein